MRVQTHGSDCVHVVSIQRTSGVTTLLVQTECEKLECVPVIGQSNATPMARNFVKIKTVFLDLTRKFELENQKVPQKGPRNVKIPEALPEDTESSLPDNLVGTSDDATTDRLEVAHLAETSIEQYLQAENDILRA